MERTDLLRRAVTVSATTAIQYTEASRAMYGRRDGAGEKTIEPRSMSALILVVVVGPLGQNQPPPPGRR